MGGRYWLTDVRLDGWDGWSLRNERWIETGRLVRDRTGQLLNVNGSRIFDQADCFAEADYWMISAQDTETGERGYQCGSRYASSPLRTAF